MIELINYNKESPLRRHCYWDEHMEDDLILNTTIAAIDKALTDYQEPGRGHLGMSQIGKADDRAIWLAFRWSLPDNIQPRVKRIFRLGHTIEAEVIDLLRMITGATVYDRDPSSGSQFNFTACQGHFGGSMDACMLGVPEAPKTWHVVEIKTVNAKRFKELQKVGVERWSQEYYAQMQCYMGASEMDRALFVAYNKDTSDLYSERVMFNRMEYQGYVARAQRIIDADEPPMSCYSGPDDIEAKKCGATSLVYWGKELPKPNCRNCISSAPVDSGAWRCSKLEKNLSPDAQAAGCDRHLYIQKLFPATHCESWSDAIQYTLSGADVYNVEESQAFRDENAYGSKELYAMCKDGALEDRLKDEGLRTIARKFDATFIG